jgi:hypothetical protein
MKGTISFFITLLIFTLLLPLAAEARGHHGNFRGGIWIGPLWDPYPYSYSYPYYYNPPVIVERPSVDYYVQPPPQQPEEPAYWYYCRKPEGYYPYVKQCPEGWMKVVPTPPSN